MLNKKIVIVRGAIIYNGTILSPGKYEDDEKLVEFAENCESELISVIGGSSKSVEEPLEDEGEAQFSESDDTVFDAEDEADEDVELDLYVSATEFATYTAKEQTAYINKLSEIDDEEQYDAIYNRLLEYEPHLKKSVVNLFNEVISEFN